MSPHGFDDEEPPPPEPRRFREITPEDLRGLPGLRRKAMTALLSRQSLTVREALSIPDVGRKTTRHLLSLGLLFDPDRLQSRSLADVERETHHRR